MSSNSLASFKKSFKGDISTPTDPDYAQAISRWAVNAQANAEVVAFVKTPEDVALSIAYAKENHLPIAIRCGGHSTGGGSSTKGLVIDLSRHFNVVRIDPENKLAYVGGGALWGQVDKAAIQHGLATVAGTVNHTGVAGLTLGGGFGLLCGEHGLVIDNLIKVTIVTANGSVLTASETENTELFWGIRGGGSNFGVVTEFVFKLHPQRRTVFAGHIIYSADILDQVFNVTDKWWPNVAQKEAIAITLTADTPGPGAPIVPLVIVTLFYNGSEEEGRANFKSFLDLKFIANLTKEIPYEELNGILVKMNDRLDHGLCRLIKGLTHAKTHLPSARKVLDRLVSLANSGVHCGVQHEFWPLEKVRSVPNGTCAFNRPKFNHGVVFVTWKDNTPENLALARSAGRELASIVASGQEEYIGKDEQGYGNYDHTPEEEYGVVTKNRAEALFRDNYPRLQELKKKHDPECIFNKWFTITPSA